MRHRYPLTIALFLVILCISVGATAEPLWTASECDAGPVHDNLADTGYSRIPYFIESDFASKMKACTPLSDNAMTEFNVRTSIKDSVEMWNAESRSAFMDYGGSFTGNPSSICQNFNGDPVVFISFQQECYQPMGSCTTNTSGVAQSLTASGCNAVHIRIFGDRNSASSCSGSGLKDWRLEESTSGTNTSFRGVIAHEVGHALGFAHPNSNSASSVTSSDSVMWSSLTASAASTALHLGAWDRDCADDYWLGRAAIARSRSYDSTGAFGENDTIDANVLTEKGSISDAPWRDSTSHYYSYSIMNGDGDYRRAFVGADGLLYWSDSGADWSPNPVDHNMLFTNALPNSSTGYSHAYYAWTPTKTTDPPNLKVVSSSNSFSSRSIYNLREEWNGSTYPPVNSHIPASAAYDPISGEKIFVTVNTDRNSADEGGIRVHPGLAYGQSYTLHSPEYAHNNITIPSVSSTAAALNWDYTGKTYFGVGVACADSVPSGFNGHNCLLAWIDRGHPDNQILYSWFKISGSNVIWDGSTYVRAGTHALNHIGLGFHSGEMHMVYKPTGSGPEIAHTTNSLSSFTSWNSVSYLNGQGAVIDPPHIAVKDDSSEYTWMWSEVP